MKLIHEATAVIVDWMMWALKIMLAGVIIWLVCMFTYAMVTQVEFPNCIAGGIFAVFITALARLCQAQQGQFEFNADFDRRVKDNNLVTCFILAYATIVASANYILQ